MPKTRYPLIALLPVNLQYSILLFVQQESPVCGINQFSPRVLPAPPSLPTIPNPNATSIFSKTGDANEAKASSAESLA